MLKSVLESCDKKFYYGCGGIGDFLLLMATFYDDIEKNEVDVVFGANNCNTILNISKLFQKVRLFRIYPLKGVHTGYDWNMIVDNNNCCGTGVTPEQFNYIEDWIKCGKSNVFDYYGVKKNPNWARANTIENLVVIQPFGGADDPTKKKEVPKSKIYSILDKHGGDNIVFTGSKNDAEKYPSYRWIITFDESFEHIKQSSKFYGCDSWGKTLAGLANIPTKVYQNQYSRPLEQIFGHIKDPSDYVFLDNWGFDYAND